MSRIAGVGLGEGDGDWLVVTTTVLVEHACAAMAMTKKAIATIFEGCIPGQFSRENLLAGKP